MALLKFLRFIRPSLQPTRYTPHHILKKRNSFLKSYPGGQSCRNLGKNKPQKLQRSEVHYFSTLSNSIYPEKKYFRYYIPREKIRIFSSLFFQAAHPTHRQHLLPGPPAPTTCLVPHSRQEQLALIPTRRHTTTNHRREHGGSERGLVYGADAGRWAI